MTGIGAAAGQLAIRLFGSLEIRDGERVLGPADLGGVRPKQVLELLLAARGHHVSTARIADQLWGEEPPRDTAAAIQTFVSVLRRRLVEDRERARGLVVTEAEGYRFATQEVELDLDRFDELLEQSARQSTRAARRSLERALALVRGDVLEDEPYALWAQDLRSTYRGRVLGARVDAGEAALAELDYAGALAHAQAAASLDDFGEHAQRLQMVALYALGRQHEALETYRRFRARLDDELGLTPTDQTRAVEAAILRQEDVRALLPRPIGEQSAVSGGALRLLGRTEELASLDHGVRAALDGSFAFVRLEGEAGFGKTRLLDEFAATIVGARVGRARCSALEQHLPYVPLAAALREAIGEESLERMHVPALRAVFPELTVDADADGRPEVETLEALVELVTAHAPLVLFLDDLHWADASTIAAIAYLRRRCSSVPAAVVAAVCREQGPPENPVHDLCSDTYVRLGPLSEADVAPLRIADLHAATGGNPRFVAEAAAHVGAPAHESVFGEALIAECRAEGPLAYRALLTASLLDEPFEPEPLAAAIRVDPIELVEELERLCERRILRVDGPRFRFRYPLVRDVLAASLSPARKRLLHAQLQGRGDALAASRPLGRETLVLDGR